MIQEKLGIEHLIFGFIFLRQMHRFGIVQDLDIRISDFIKTCIMHPVSCIQYLESSI